MAHRSDSERQAQAEATGVDDGTLAGAVGASNHADRRRRNGPTHKPYDVLSFVLALAAAIWTRFELQDAGVAPGYVNLGTLLAFLAVAIAAMTRWGRKVIQLIALLAIIWLIGIYVFAILAN
jgi:hypothetical protein